MTAELPTEVPLEIPVLPLRDVVVFPYMVIPLFVGRLKSIRALEAAMVSNKQILLAAQKKAEIDDPTAKDIYHYGTLANVLQLLKLPDGTVKVLVEGTERAKIDELLVQEEYLRAKAQIVKKQTVKSREIEILSRTLIGQFEQYVKLNKKIPAEILSSVSSIEDADRLSDSVAAHLNFKVPEKQEVLETEDVSKRLERLVGLIEGEIDMFQLEKRIRGRVKRQMEKSQREYYLHEQMKAIQTELGEGEDGESDLDKLAEEIKKSGMHEEARKKAESELKKLRMMSPMSAEATVSRNYIDWLVKVPWKKRTRVRYDLKKAQEILDAEHYGLEKVKERIIEFLAVQQRVKKVKGAILCLVGPPGVGKTSLGRSIAQATGRKFVRFSLGGVRDEAEIRGHRRTYIGAMPGKIIQKLAKVEVRNPLFQLDEVDKMAMDFRGDPASALLEVLDPEQNNIFSDHFLEVDVDLSDVMFISTANSLEIPGPLLDRMEVIRMAGYTEHEKIHIAKRHLLPKTIKDHGLKEGEFAISENGLKDIIRYYTREAGVRNLEREIAKLCRKSVKLLVEDKSHPKIEITQRNIEKFLGVKKFRYGIAEGEDRIGFVNGLAWTEVGGELLTIETVAVPGKGKSAYTGQLGDIMQESIQAAMTVVRSRTKQYDIPKDFYEKFDIHVHVPEGATPKDGPSAGISMCTALVSALSKIPVRADVAMTGEITLRGEVLPIGGLKEKLLAANRGGIKDVIIPEENRRDLKEVPKQIMQGLRIHPVQWIDQVLDIALQMPSNPPKKKGKKTAVQPVETKLGKDGDGAPLTN